MKQYLLRKLRLGRHEDHEPSSSVPDLPRPSSRSQQQQQQQNGPGSQATVSSSGLAAVEASLDEEERQIQLAVALSVSEEASERISSVEPELVAYRYWADNVLDYEDRVVDGFYDVYGVVYDPDTPDKMPKLVDLQAEEVSAGVSSEVVLVNRSVDPELSQLERRAVAECRGGQADPIASGLARRIALLVSDRMGGPVSSHVDMLTVWTSTSWDLRCSLQSNVMPIGKLQVGLARHRALLYKVLADHVGVSCRLVKGKRLTGADEGAVNILKDALSREYHIDLMRDPGALTMPESQTSVPLVGKRHHSEPDGLLEALTKPPTERERRHGISHFRSPSWTEGLGSPAAIRQREANDILEAAKVNPNLAQKLHVFLDNAPSGLFRDQSQSEALACVKPSPKGTGKPPPIPKVGAAKDRLPRLESVEGLGERRPLDASACSSPAAAAALVLNAAAVHEAIPPDKLKAITAAVVASLGVVAAKMDRSAETSLEVPLTAATAAVVAATSALKSDNVFDKPDRPEEDITAKSDCNSNKSEKVDTDMANSRGSSLLDVAECEIPWEELHIGDRIGLGSYGEVYRGDWHGTEVAVKRFLNQDISGDALEEFITEVRLMKRMRHPNVVLFMGAITRPPHLSIVTEFLPRGSLFKLLHRPQCQLDERRRLRMALDVAKGMNYLHNSNPMIVHRDLKSPNLLVDKNWVVKVCDFGLSRMKHHTFLSSKSQAGTPEWMAPEVLRNEPSNEKADVYSFGVILWELATLQLPWAGMNPMQVVGAVGFQDRRLDIPESVDASISKIIQECWHEEPNLRPSFAKIMTALPRAHRERRC